jgi:hypothetical protein
MRAAPLSDRASTGGEPPALVVTVGVGMAMVKSWAGTTPVVAETLGWGMALRSATLEVFQQTYKVRL